MINGKRNGFGILKSVKECSKNESLLDRTTSLVGRAIYDRFGKFLAIVDFKDGLPSGEFAYYFPIAFVKTEWKSKFNRTINALDSRVKLTFLTLNFQVSGTCLY